MPHCNDSPCTRSVRWDGDHRLCDCDCSTCVANARGPGPKARASAGTCESCGARVGPSDEFCDGCGAAVPERARARALTRELDETWDRNSRAATTAAGVEKGSRMIGTLSIVFGVSGCVMYVMQRDTANKALRNLSSYENDAVVTLEGVEYKVGPLREQIKAEPTQLLVGNLVLALIMAALWQWSAKKPLPAIATALAMFVVVNFVNFLIDPKTLVQGIIIKVLAIGALGTGLKSALAAQANAQEQEQAA